MSFAPLRFFESWAKLTLFAVWILLLIAGNSLLTALGVLLLLQAIYTSVLNSAVVIVAIRCFRGKGEQRQAPRPWWRATGGQTSALIVGVAVLVGVLVEIVALTTMGGDTPAFFLGHGVLLAQFSLGSVYFLHSAYRSRSTSDEGRYLRH